MSDCCTFHPSGHMHRECPQCGTQCKAVTLKTLWHNLRFPDYLSTPVDNYFFCPTVDCQVGYFSPTTVIALHTLKAYPQIQQGWLCYCFDLSQAQYRIALKSGYADNVKNFIIQQTKSGNCACEIKNPSGQCCLAKFKHIESFER